MTLFLTLTIVKLANYLVSIAVSYIHPSTLTIVKLASYLVSIAVSYIHPSTLTIIKLATYLVSIAVSFIHPSAFLFLPDITKLKPRSQCYVRPCVPFRNVVAEYCERNLRITARTCGAYGGLRKDKAMFYPCVAHVTDDQSKCSKFSPRGGVNNSSELRYIPSMDVEERLS